MKLFWDITFIPIKILFAILLLPFFVVGVGLLVAAGAATLQLGIMLLPLILAILVIRHFVLRMRVI